MILKCKATVKVHEWLSDEYEADRHTCNRPAGHTGVHTCHCRRSWEPSALGEDATSRTTPRARRPGAPKKMKRPPGFTHQGPSTRASVASTIYQQAQYSRKAGHHRLFSLCPLGEMAAVSSRGRPSEGEHQPGQQPAAERLRPGQVREPPVYRIPIPWAEVCGPGSAVECGTEIKSAPGDNGVAP